MITKKRVVQLVPALLAFLLLVSACALLNLPPTAVFIASPVAGTSPLLVTFDATGSSDSDGTIVAFEWTYGDGSTGQGATPSHTYELAGTYTVHLTITDDDGAIDKANALVIEVSEPMPSSSSPGANSSPTASFTASPMSGSAPLDVGFDASVSVDADGLIASYVWSFGDGGSASGAAASHTYTSAGTYTAQLIVTDDDGASGTATRTIQVSSAIPTANNAPAASFTALPSSGEAPLDVAFDASSSGDADGSITSYEWSFGDGGSSSGVTASHTYDSAGTYTVQLTVTDDDGERATDTRTIQVSSAIPVANSSPTASFTASPTSGEASLDVNFDASSSSDSDGSIASYVWSFGDGGSSSGATANHTYDSAGTFTVQLTVTDDDGASATATRTIQVSNSTPGSNQPPTAGFWASKGSGRPPLEVDFYASWYSEDSDGSIVSYHWEFGDGGTASGHTTSHTYNSVGSYTVVLTVTDNEGATDVAVKQITVFEGGC